MVSDHYKSMQIASPDSMLGDFSDITVVFHGIESRFFSTGDEYFVDTLGDDGEPQTFPIKYTFGYSPLQQYLVELNNGHVQALNLAWDSRSQDEGGQRWFHLQPDEDITPEHPFFWSNHFQNWNSRCAECHSTDLQRNYDPVSLSYDTQWSEINVACEACHGPASDHVSMAQSGFFTGSLMGFEKNLSDNSQFVFEGDAVIAGNANTTSVEQLNTCAVCHSRRGIVGRYEAQKDYHEQFQLSQLNQGLYFADGQIDDEVFVFGSFLQSKMYAAGVTCTDCHNPHSTQLKATGNALCQQCHRSDSYQTTEHHRHNLASAGAQCVSCHMPQRTYMQVDARRDHGFSIPRPALANKVGAPNACANCHENWEPSQVVANYIDLFGRESTSAWADANHEARNLNILALPNILAIADDTSVAPIRRASLLLQAASYPARITLESIQKNLRDSEPLVRRAAVDATAFLPPEGRLQILNSLIDDPVKSVRMAVASQLAASFAIASESDRPRILRIFEEYEQSLLLNQDTPGTQMNLAIFFYQRGDRTRA
jgi:predicted CXXCH cytochrome family protein